MEQLKYWKDKGYYISLDVVRGRQWILVVGTEPVNDWQDRGYDLGLINQRVRFVSLPCDTPEECIKAAMEVLR
jgi:hypothetical protein